MKTHINFLLYAVLGILMFPMTASAQQHEMPKDEKLWKQAEAAAKVGNNEQAYKLYKQCINATKDEMIKKECETRIKSLNIIKKDSPFLTVQDTVRIPATGQYQKVTIRSNPKSWTYKIISGQLSEIRKDGNQLLVVSQSTNKSLERLLSVVQITAGHLSKNLYVVQDAAPEELRSSSEELNPPAKGEQYVLNINANYKAWTCTEGGEWYQARRDSDKLIIEISPNDLLKERSGNIIIKGKRKNLTIKIIQHADEEKLSFSHNSLYFPVEGESCTVAVHTNAAEWHVGAAPDWCDVQKVGDDSIRITTYWNRSDNIPREASIWVNTGLQSQSLNIYQDARPYVPEYVFAKIVPGRNLSFGVNASLLYPMVSTSAGGSYVGSVMDYSLGNDKEKASYTSSLGYNFGVHADIRLYRNLFLMAGANFIQVHYKNTFSEPTEFTRPHTAFEYLSGTVQNAYKEEYSHTMIEVPLLASYRFVINKKSHLQLNFGPFINFGLSSKMKLSGSTDSETMHKYNIREKTQVDGGNYINHTTASAEFNLYKPCVLWTEKHTTGNDADIQHHEKFTESPLRRINCGLRVGAAYELAGLSFGLYYNFMLTNMANKGYWNNERFTVLNNSDTNMSGYNHRIHSFELKMAYTFRYSKKTQE